MYCSFLAEQDGQLKLVKWKTKISEDMFFDPEIEWTKARIYYLRNANVDLRTAIYHKTLVSKDRDVHEWEDIKHLHLHTPPQNREEMLAQLNSMLSNDGFSEGEREVFSHLVQDEDGNDQRSVN